MPIDQLFSSLTSSSSAKGALSGAASGAVVSMLMNKKARKKIGGSVATIGGAAALAGVGYFAYQKWQKSKAGGAGAAFAVRPADQNSAPARSSSADSGVPAVPSVLPAASGTALQVSDSLAMKMVKAMIAAAYSDGHIDDAEMDQLENAVASANLTAAENREMMAALNAPPSAQEIAALAESPEEAAELYGAAALAIDSDTVAEKFFLRQLAGALKLDSSLVAEINSTTIG